MGKTGSSTGPDLDIHLKNDGKTRAEPTIAASTLVDLDDRKAVERRCPKS
jgi:hypothetical protein